MKKKNKLFCPVAWWRVHPRPICFDVHYLPPFTQYIMSYTKHPEFHWFLFLKVLFISIALKKRLAFIRQVEEHIQAIWTSLGDAWSSLTKKPLWPGCEIFGATCTSDRNVSSWEWSSHHLWDRYIFILGWTWVFVSQHATNQARKWTEIKSQYEFGDFPWMMIYEWCKVKCVEFQSVSFARLQ